MSISLALLLLVAVGVVLGIKIVPQSENYVVERFGKFRKILTPGPNIIIPGIDRIAHKVSVLERQLDDYPVEAITKDNSPIKVTASTFFRVIDPPLSVYRIRNIERAIQTAVTGVVRSLIGTVEFDEVQSNREQVNTKLKSELDAAAQEWGVEITRSEIIDVAVDDATRQAMLVQITAERERRAAVTQAEGQKKAAELAADAELYAATKAAEARRISAEAEAFATKTVAEALQDGGLDAARFAIARDQIKAMAEIAKGDGTRTVLLPNDMATSFSSFAGLAAILQGSTDGETKPAGPYAKR